MGQCQGCDPQQNPDLHSESVTTGSGRPAAEVHIAGPSDTVELAGPAPVEPPSVALQLPAKHVAAADLEPQPASGALAEVAHPPGMEDACGSGRAYAALGPGALQLPAKQEAAAGPMPWPSSQSVKPVPPAAVSGAAERLSTSATTAVVASSGLQPSMRSRSLSPASAARLEELGETPEKRTRCVEDLRAKLRAIASEKPALAPALQRFLEGGVEHLPIAFLRNKNYNVENSVAAIEAVAEYMTEYPMPEDPARIAAMKELSMSNMKMCDFTYKDGTPVISILDMKSFMESVGVFPMREYASVTMDLWMNELLAADDVQLLGLVIVEDLSTFTVSQATALKRDKDLIDVKKKGIELQNSGAFPVKVKAVYVIDSPWYFNFFWVLLRPFMKQKIRDRIKWISRAKFEQALRDGKLFRASPEQALATFAKAA